MFYDAEKFSFIRLFQENWNAIHEEYKALQAEVLKEAHRNSSHEEFFEKVKNDTENYWIPSWQAGTAEQNPNWLTYWLSYYGHFSAGTREKLPTLTRVLEQAPCVRLCAFSKMKPLSVIGAHNHPELGGDILTLHIGVDVVPATCYLHVEGQFAEEGNNKPVIFDGSKYHFAVNAGVADRTILYIEFDQSKAN